MPVVLAFFISAVLFLQRNTRLINQLYC